MISVVVAALLSAATTTAPASEDLDDKSCIPFGEHCRAGDVIYAKGYGIASLCDFSKSIIMLGNQTAVCVYRGAARADRQ